MQIFPIPEFSVTEMEVVATHLSTPAVTKYLHYLAYVNATAIATTGPAEGESDATYLRRVEGIRGRLEALDTLLTIAAQNQSTTP